LWPSGTHQTEVSCLQRTQLIDSAYLINDYDVLDQLLSALHSTYSTLLNSTSTVGGLLLHSENTEIPRRHRYKCMPQQCKKRNTVHSDDGSNDRMVQNTDVVSVDTQLIDANCLGTFFFALCTVHPVPNAV